MKNVDIKTYGIVGLFPKSLRKYAILSRIDKPIGYFLLWIPNVWGALLASSMVKSSFLDVLYISFLTLVGAVVMRSAGCIWNDIIDRDFDRQVYRTNTRPIASGCIGLKQAYIFLFLQLIVGFVIFLFFPFAAKIAGILALFFAVLYPFAKRFTYWPQVLLGIAFNGGIWVGWLSFTTESLYIPLLLHIALIFWTLGYDTIYAHQDREDDIRIGVKSSAIKLGDNSQFFIGLFYSIVFLIFILVGIFLQFTMYFYAILVLVGISFSYQVLKLNIRDSDLCLSLFKHNYITSFFITGAILVANLGF